MHMPFFVSESHKYHLSDSFALYIIYARSDEGLQPQNRQRQGKAKKQRNKCLHSTHSPLLSPNLVAGWQFAVDQMPFVRGRFPPGRIRLLYAEPDRPAT